MCCVVLVVEDDPIVRMGAVAIVEEAGFKVYSAPNADAAVSVLEVQDDVTLMFTDIDMPGTMDGLELADVVHERWPNVRLLVTSGHTVIPNSELPDDGRFVEKPYGATTIREAIRDAIENHRPEAKAV